MRGRGCGNGDGRRLLRDESAFGAERRSPTRRSQGSARTERGRRAKSLKISLHQVVALENG